MSVEELFKINLKKGVCLPNLSEDNIRDIVNSLEVVVKDTDFKGFVRSSNGTVVSFQFDSTGNFAGAFASIGGNRVEIMSGVGSPTASLFIGSPSATSPGAGWEILESLTKTILNQPEDMNQWVLFLARRVPVINA